MLLGRRAMTDLFVVQSLSCECLQSNELQHARLPCLHCLPRACSNSCQWCHPTISFSLPFSSCLQSFPASGSFQMSQFFASGGQSIGVSASASAFPMNIQDWICYNVASLRESFLKNNFILAVLVFRWCTRAFFSCGGHGLLSSCSAWASHCSGFSCCGAQALGCVTCSSCGSQTLEHRLSSCDTVLPGPGIKLVSPALASIFFTTEPPRKPTSVFYVFFWSMCHMGS